MSPVRSFPLRYITIYDTLYMYCYGQQCCELQAGWLVSPSRSRQEVEPFRVTAKIYQQRAGDMLDEEINEKLPQSSAATEVWGR